jgi:hypothetical protein
MSQILLNCQVVLLKENCKKRSQTRRKKLPFVSHTIEFSLKISSSVKYLLSHCKPSHANQTELRRII